MNILELSKTVREEDFDCTKRESCKGCNCIPFCNLNSSEIPGLIKFAYDMGLLAGSKTNNSLNNN